MSRGPSVLRICYSPDGSRVAWTSTDETLRVWDGAEVKPPLHLPSARNVAFGSALLAVSDGARPIVRLVDAKTMAVVRIVGGCSGTSTGTGSAVALTVPYGEGSVDAGVGGVYAVVDGQSVRVERYAGGSLCAFAAGEVVMSAVFDGHGRRLATGHGRGVVRLWDVSQRTPVCRLVVTGAHRALVSSLAFSADGARLASAGWDGLVHVWDAQATSSNRLLTLRVEKGGRKVHAVALPGHDARETNIVAAGGANGAVRIWRVPSDARECNSRATIAPLAVYEARSSAVFALSFAPDGSHVASSSSDGIVRLFGVPSLQLITSQREKNTEQSAWQHFPSEDSSRAIGDSARDAALHSQRSGRSLIFCPTTVVSLTCPICTSPYDCQTRAPVCSGVCGHTFACRACSDTMLANNDASSRCPVCRTDLLDVAPNYELMRVLSATVRAVESGTAERTDSEQVSASRIPDPQDLTTRRDYISMDRLSWIESSDLEYLSSPVARMYSGTMDGEAVGIRIATKSGDSALTADVNRQAERNYLCLEQLRGPHIVQFYGISRTPVSDNRLVVVTELPAGGTLANNLRALRSRNMVLSIDEVMSVSLQICRALLFLHRNNISAGAALLPSNIGLTTSILTTWTPTSRAKFCDLGDTTQHSPSTHSPQDPRAHHSLAYLPPETLDDDGTTPYLSRAAAFARDSYTLGVVLFELATGREPFEGLRPAQIISRVVGRDERPGWTPAGAPQELQELISALWARDPKERPSAEQACLALDRVPSAPPL